MKKIPFTSDTLQLDTLSVVPESLILTDMAGAKVDTTLYDFEPFKAQVVRLSPSMPDTIMATYRVYPFNIYAPTYHKKYQQFNGEEIVFGKFTYQVKKEAIDIFDLGDLNYSGSFSRGISVGSNQDLVVNSNFNLQLQGKLKNDITVRAAITDNNIPFQAQGNTQQLQEFDRIFIELSKGKTSLILGDYDLKRPKSYFMNYYKRLQGISGQSSMQLKRGEVGGKVAAAVARGQYNRMSFMGVEGNQGPYKLIGANGESFIIILSGSERVYIDGEQLVRGFNNDYTIDYNLGEVTFTPNRLITKDARIVVEFEYSVQNFLRSLLYAESYFKNKKWEVAAHFYTEQDAKNQPLLQDLSGEQKDFLGGIGDDINNALFSGIDSIGYTEERVLYAKKDSVVSGVSYEYFVYSQNPETAIYALNFSNVGLGNGNYVLSTSGVNGRIYEWLAPDSLGSPLGDYEPVILLITPKRRQMATAKAIYKINAASQLNAEVALSNFDQNTFSDISDKDDKGLAVKVEWEQEKFFKKNENWSVKTKTRYEFVQDNFVPLEQYRPIEFTRDWNTDRLGQTNDEHLPSAFVQLSQRKWGLLNYSFNAYVRPNEYEGYRQIAQNKINRKGFKWDGVFDYLTTDATEETSTFLRPKFALSYQSAKTKMWEFGIKAQQEKNSIRLKGTDSLSLNSIYFDIAEVYIASPKDAENQVGLSWVQRWDYAPNGDQFKGATYGNTIKVNGALAKNPKNQLRWNATFRRLDILDGELSNLKPENTLLGEVNYYFEAFKGLVRSTTNYKLGSGQTQIVEYEYTPVTNGLGTHVWNDLNQNNIKEINEFRLIFENEFPDTTYIQINVPTNIYTRTNIASFSQNLNIIPKRILFKKKGFLGWLGKWEYQGFAELSRHFPADSSGRAWNFYVPGNFHLSDEVLDLVVSERSAYRNSLFYDRIGKLLSGELFYNINRNKDLLVNGFVQNEKADRGLKLRSRIKKQWTLEFKAANGFTRYLSAADPNSNYDIDYQVIEPSAKYQKKQKWSIIASYRYKQSENIGGEKGTENNGSLLFKYSVAQKSALDCQFSYISIKYTGDLGSNFNLDNQILQGLQTGSNYVWNVTYRTKVSKNIELRLTYNGKKSEDLKLQNTGRVQVTALF